jgi:hypothetical protein
MDTNFFKPQRAVFSPLLPPGRSRLIELILNPSLVMGLNSQSTTEEIAEQLSSLFGGNGSSEAYEAITLFIAYLKMTNQELPWIYRLLESRYFGDEALNIYYGYQQAIQNHGLLAEEQTDGSIRGTFAYFLCEFTGKHIAQPADFFESAWIKPAMPYRNWKEPHRINLHFSSLEELLASDVREQRILFKSLSQPPRAFARDETRRGCPFWQIGLLGHEAKGITKGFQSPPSVTKSFCNSL